MQIEQILIASIAAIPGLLAIFLQYRKSKSEINKDKSEATKLITEAAGGVIKNLKEEICRLERKIEKLVEANKELDGCKDQLEEAMYKIAELEKSVNFIQNGE